MPGSTCTQWSRRRSGGGEGQRRHRDRRRDSPGHAGLAPRSGLAARHGIALVNSPGPTTRDTAARSGCPLEHGPRRPLRGPARDRIAQLVVMPCAAAEPVEAVGLENLGAQPPRPVPTASTGSGGVGRHHELRDAVARPGPRTPGAVRVQEQHPDLAAVSRVDQPGRVDERDPVPRGQAGARQHEAGVARRNLHRDPGAYAGPLPRPDRGRL